jgi:dTDP-glucose pyrophosphorylase
MKKFSKYICNFNDTIQQAYNHIKKNKTTFVLVKKGKKIIGTFTLGDFKKALFKGVKLSSRVSRVASKNFFYVNKDYNKSQLKRTFSRNTLDFIPVLENFVLVDIIFKREIFKLYNKLNNTNKNNIAVVIMAGGFGKRLQPVSTVLPKALMPFPDKPIIHEIINNFLNQGYKNLFVTLNYKADLIKSYLSQFSNFKINYINEKKPMGTCGSLNNNKLTKFKHLIVANCDTLIKSNMDDILSDHLSFKNDLTIVTSVKKHIFDYGVCDLDKNGKLIKINEKPEFNFLINTGLYLLDSKMLSFIKQNNKYDMDQFINLLLKNKKNISTSTILDRDFIDMGQWKFYLNYLKNTNQKN